MKELPESLCTNCVYGISMEGKMIHVAAKSINSEPDDKKNWGKSYDPSMMEDPEYETNVTFEEHITKTVSTQCFWPHAPEYKQVPLYFTPNQFSDMIIEKCSRYCENSEYVDPFDV